MAKSKENFWAYAHNYERRCISLLGRVFGEREGLDIDCSLQNYYTACDEKFKFGVIDLVDIIETFKYSSLV
jgi:hypothetical protein